MSQFIGGLDLGQTKDPSALAVSRKDGEGKAARYTLLVLRRFELKTAYTGVVDETGEVMTTPPLAGAPLVIDETGVGRPVCDMAAKRLTRTPIFRVTITGGHAATKQEDGSWHVPKKVLVSTLSLVHQGGRLIVPTKLLHGPTLAREMENFRCKITASANETFEAWREGQNDDLVLAVALMVWAGETFWLGPWGPPDRSSFHERPPRGVFIDHEDTRPPHERMDDPDGYDGGGPLYPSSW